MISWVVAERVMCALTRDAVHAMLEVVMVNIASESIERLRKRFQREWLLIALTEMDDATTTPVRGRLLAHSPHRDEIDRASRKYPKPALVVFSEDAFPPGYAAAFCSA